MKGLASVVLFAVMLVAVPALGQTTNAAPPAKPSKLITLAGIVSADRKSFLCDKDNRALAIANPDVLRGLEGRHATLRARLDSSTPQLVISSAKPSRDERHAPRLDDAAFRK
jgi:hypothetical protein